MRSTVHATPQRKHFSRQLSSSLSTYKSFWKCTHKKSRCVRFAAVAAVACKLSFNFLSLSRSLFTTFQLKCMLWFCSHCIHRLARSSWSTCAWSSLPPSFRRQRNVKWNACDRSEHATHPPRRWRAARTTRSRRHATQRSSNTSPICGAASRDEC